jgi:hypothetical protein
MRKLATKLSMTAAISLVGIGGGFDTAFAAESCQTTQSQCYDTKTKQTRTCTTQTCTDANGKVTSSSTIIEQQGTGGTTSTKPKSPTQRAPGSESTR